MPIITEKRIDEYYETRGLIVEDYEKALWEMKKQTIDTIMWIIIILILLIVQIPK